MKFGGILFFCYFFATSKKSGVNQLSVTLPKANSLHLKIGRDPKGKDRLPTTVFQVRAVSFREGTRSKQMLFPLHALNINNASVSFKNWMNQSKPPEKIKKSRGKHTGCHITTWTDDGHQEKNKKKSSSWWLNQPLWKICSSKWESSPNRGENKTCLKPRPSLPWAKEHHGCWMLKEPYQAP